MLCSTWRLPFSLCNLCPQFPFVDFPHVTVLSVILANEPFIWRMGGSQHSSVTAVGIATFQTMDFPRTPLLCGLELFLLVWNNKAACFLYSFLHCLSFTSALGADVWLPWPDCCAQCPPQKSTGWHRADVGKDAAPPFRNVLDTHTHGDVLRASGTQGARHGAHKKRRAFRERTEA